jgi:hypothetical protein
VTVWLVNVILVEVVGIVSWMLSHGPVRTCNQNLDVSQLAIAGAVGRECTNVHCILPPRYTASQRFPYDALVPERLRGEALECGIRQDGLRIKYPVLYIRAPFDHVAGVISKQTSGTCRRRGRSVDNCWGAYIESPALELQCNIKDVPPRCAVGRVPSEGCGWTIGIQNDLHLRVSVLTWRVSVVLNAVFRTSDLRIYL